MKKVLTTEEWIAKRRAEAAERRKHSKPAKLYKSAQVTAYRQFTQINSQAVYRGGCHDPKGYEDYFPPEMNAHDIGREARKALLASRFITPDHPEWDGVMRFPTKDEFKAWEEADKARAGVKTLKALFNGAGQVSLRLQDGQIEIKPWRYRGRGHWEGIREHEDTVMPEAESDAALGKAILDALDISRSA